MSPTQFPSRCVSGLTIRLAFPKATVTDSFMLPTVPSQLPTILVSIRFRDRFWGLQDETPNANARSRPSRTKLKLCFIGIFSFQVF